MWDHGKLIDLGTLGGTCGVPNALNNRGQVVGLSDTAGDAAYHAFIWPGKNNQMQDIGTLGGCCAIANWLNDAGAVVGGSWTTNDQEFHAFIWKNGVMNDLGPQGLCTEALGINSQDQVVGFTCVNGLGDAVLWENGQFIDLNTFNHSGSSLQQLVLAYNINDSGEIDGLGVPAGCGDPFSCGHTFVLIPCDANHPGIEGCDYSLMETTATMPTPGDSRTVSPQMPTTAPAIPHSRFRTLPSSSNDSTGTPDFLHDRTLCIRGCGGVGNCAVDSRTGKLDGTCIGPAQNGFCTSKYNPTQCPPGKNPIAPTNLVCGMNVGRVDARRTCRDR